MKNIKFLFIAVLIPLLLTACATTSLDVPGSYAGEGVAPSQLPEFSWENATVYFVIIDRFANGNPANDTSYGRFRDGGDEVGTFHGGDLAGLTAKIEEGYFADLGVNALWISSPLEQIHGWVGGGDGSFAHFAYHGYYPMDFTRIDANMGTEEEFARFMDAAHENGIRVVMDVVMNHAGYNSVKDMRKFDFGGWKGEPLPEDWVPENNNWHSHHDYIDYSGQEDAWARWWGPDWVRGGIPGYPAPGDDDLTSSVGFLPDFRTESSQPVDPPVFLMEKAAAGNSDVEPLENATVRDYLITWLTDWVRDYGIDGFRIDTAKHVGLDAWQELAVAADEALAEWKAENPEKALDDLPFWMTGEVFGQGVGRNAYFDNGFDSLINFEFQMNADRAIHADGTVDAEALEGIYSRYARTINSDPGFNMLSYISSHDTVLFYNTRLSNNGYRVNGGNAGPERQKAAGTALMLVPGAVQVFYGDELAREYQPYRVGDPGQGTRTPQPWENLNSDVHRHWQKLGRFRASHISVGAGVHSRVEVKDADYAFARNYHDLDKVLVVLGGEGSLEIPVEGFWEDGLELRDAYSGSVAAVENGRVTFDAEPSAPLLIEEAR
ncbi:alpha-amylase family glycosyl hydrolase [Salinispira pacifica]|uniref:Periplasmic alpha-amylase n=1 Tax=Salinispira pacifica TaxID=1307761 RepID=V5WL36_9SPIO|nr:alpha-amylase family glycosyl hydrolase [Salinispira pacifica]AHC15906.1 Periplasmic alpha-amylase [Salinispira pacifica]